MKTMDPGWNLGQSTQGVTSSGLYPGDVLYQHIVTRQPRVVLERLKDSESRLLHYSFRRMRSCSLRRSTKDEIIISSESDVSDTSDEEWTTQRRGSAERKFCRLCPFSCTRQHELDRHVSNTHRDVSVPYFCSQCLQGFTEFSSLTQHVHEKCKEALLPQAKARTNRKRRRSSNAIRKLAKRHESEVDQILATMDFTLPEVCRNIAERGCVSSVCMVCGLVFDAYSTMLQHQQDEHQDELSYICQNCHCRFPDCQGLRLHLTKHKRTCAETVLLQRKAAHSRATDTSKTHSRAANTSKTHSRAAKTSKTHSRAANTSRTHSCAANTSETCSRAAKTSETFIDATNTSENPVTVETFKDNLISIMDLPVFDYVPELLSFLKSSSLSSKNSDSSCIQCPLCSKFCEADQILKHLHEHKKSLYRCQLQGKLLCDICFIESSNIDWMLQHRKTEHGKLLTSQNAVSELTVPRRSTGVEICPDAHEKSCKVAHLADNILKDTKEMNSNIEITSKGNVGTDNSEIISKSVDKTIQHPVPNSIVEYLNTSYLMEEESDQANKKIPMLHLTLQADRSTDSPLPPILGSPLSYHDDSQDSMPDLCLEAPQITAEESSNMDIPVNPGGILNPDKDSSDIHTDNECLLIPKLERNEDEMQLDLSDSNPIPDINGENPLMKVKTEKVEPELLLQSQAACKTARKDIRERSFMDALFGSLSPVYCSSESSVSCDSLTVAKSFPGDRQSSFRTLEKDRISVKASIKQEHKSNENNAKTDHNKNVTQTSDGLVTKNKHNDEILVKNGSDSGECFSSKSTEDMNVDSKSSTSGVSPNSFWSGNRHRVNSAESDSGVSEVRLEDDDLHDEVIVIDLDDKSITTEYIPSNSVAEQSLEPAEHQALMGHRTVSREPTGSMQKFCDKNSHQILENDMEVTSNNVKSQEEQILDASIEAKNQSQKEEFLTSQKAMFSKLMKFLDVVSEVPGSMESEQAPTTSDVSVPLIVGTKPDIRAYNQIRERHRRKHKRQLLTCTTCGKGFPSIGLLTKHERFAHSSGTAYISKLVVPNPVPPVVTPPVHQPALKLRAYACSKCGEYFQSLALLHHHKQAVHNLLDEFLCLKCDRSFSSRGQLQTHTRSIHRGPSIDGASTQPLTLPVLTTSMLKKAYFPEGGDDSSDVDYQNDDDDDYMPTGGSKSKLKKQKKRGRPRKYALPISANQTASQQPVTQTEKKLVCNLCESSFVQKASLDRHMKTHQNVRYVCDVCGLVYVQTYSVLYHRQKTHPEATPVRSSQLRVQLDKPPQIKKGPNKKNVLSY